MALSTDEVLDRIERTARARLESIQRNKTAYDDFPTFSADCLTIRPKTGGDQLFRLNTVQRIVHAQIEMQRKSAGRVRAIILKARQPGISTYVAGRYYHAVTRNNGRRAFILTHEDKATENVFEMVQRFHEHNPHAPHTGASSAKELYFDKIDSGFVVGTAGSKSVGRSFTFQYFHGSEVAFWPNAEAHAKGALQAVPNVPGTEVILESTAEGMGGLFYNMTMAAQRGESAYKLIFVPWYAHTEYAENEPEGWEAPGAMAEYGVKHNLSQRQLFWACMKNAEMASASGDPIDEPCGGFMQEYPTSVDEAFRGSRKGSFIRAEIVLRARKANIGAQEHAPIILGVDVATGGDADPDSGRGEAGDRNVIIDRQGRAAGRRVYERFVDRNTVSVAGRVARAIERINPDHTILDAGGGGASVKDILVGHGFRNVSVADFGSGALDKRKYQNKRAEMWGEMRDWLGDEGGADIPDCDVLDTELTAVGARQDSNHRTLLQSKQDVRKAFKFSPDGADALAVTFAFPVQKRRPVMTGQGARSVGDPKVAY